MSAAIWDQYWRTGHKHSCYASGAPVEHAALWRSFFADCPPGARVLDLACGAGAVACVAREAGRGFDITGVDFATQVQSLEGVKLVLGAPLEALPLPDASFDVAVSQYGFEYADAAPAARELARVLAPGGAMALIVHAAEGAPVRDIAGRLERGRRVLAPGGFADAVLRLADALIAGAPAEALAAEAEAARVAEAKAEHDGTTRRVLAVVSDAFFARRLFGGEHVRAHTAAIIAELRDYVERIAAMTEAARTRDQAEALARHFEALGLRVSPIEGAYADNGDLAGWRLQARRG